MNKLCCVIPKAPRFYRRAEGSYVVVRLDYRIQYQREVAEENYIADNADLEYIFAWILFFISNLFVK